MQILSTQHIYFFRRIVVISIIITGLFIVSATPAFAHSTGKSLEKEVGSMHIDIGYSTQEFASGNPVILNFSLKDLNEKDIHFSSVWVRIVKKRSTLFATGVFNSDLGGAIMTYTFPKEGEYTLSVRFDEQDKTIVRAEFPLKVVTGIQMDSNKKNSKIPTLILLSIGILIGLFGILLVQKLYK